VYGPPVATDFYVPVGNVQYVNPDFYAGAFEDPSSSSDEQYAVHDLYAEMYGYNIFG